MDTNIYYTPESKGLLITSNFEEIKKLMDLGVNPRIEYQQLIFSDFGKYEIEWLAFEKVENLYFQKVSSIFSISRFKTIAFHESNIDLYGHVLNTESLVIGERCQIDLVNEYFNNLKKINFLSLKTFKGEIKNPILSVLQAILWDTTEGNILPEMFPDLNELTINKGSITKLDLIQNKNLEKLDIHLCSKLENILLPEDHKLNFILIENCKNLDVSNLPSDVTSVWPKRKENANLELDSKNTVLKGDEHFTDSVADLRKDMENFMNESDPSYTQSDIDKCIRLLSECVIKVAKSKSEAKVMENVKATVLKLNDLNEKSNFSLIETNEREKIVDIIMAAVSEAGYNSIDEDITEEWREW